MDEYSKAGKLGNSSEAYGRRDLMKGLVAGGAALTTIGGLDGERNRAFADSSPAQTPKRGGTLRIAITGGTASDTLDAHNVVTQPDVYRCLALYDGLVALTADAKVVNALAESMETDAKASSWTIRIRRDAKFHDGRPVTAKDVAATFKRVTNPKSPAVGAVALAPLDLGAIQYLDERTLRIPTHTPYAVLPDVIAYPLISGIVPADYDPAKPIGAGPFKLKSMKPAQQTELVRFDDYWGGAAHLDGIVIAEQFENDFAAYDALKSGQVDAFANAPSHLAREVAGSSSLKALISYPSEFLPFTMKADAPPFDNPDVRMAMRLLIDRQRFVKIAFSGLGEIANDLYGPYDPFFDGSLKRVQDVDKAKYLLKKAGMTAFPFEMTTADMCDGMMTMAQIFAQQATKASVSVNVKQIDLNLFNQNMFGKVAFSQDFYQNIPIMGQAPISFLPGAFFNETHWADAEYFDVYKQAQGAVDLSLRRDLIHRLQKIEFERGTYIIPAYTCIVDLLAKNVMGLPKAKTGYAMGNFELAKAWLA
jgi:peptide/nickel transport system substrate-binding protein